MKLAIVKTAGTSVVGIYSYSTGLFTTLDGKWTSTPSKEFVVKLLEECDVLTAEQSIALVEDESLKGWTVSLLYKENDCWNINIVKGDYFQILSFG